jgi:HPr kinase/phosphorylase
MGHSASDENPSISVGEFLAHAPPQLALGVLAGAEGLDLRQLTTARIQKLGLAFAGFTHYVHAGRLQIVGQSEIWFLNQLTTDKRREAIGNLGLEKISCVLVTKGLEPPLEMIEACRKAGLPLLGTPLVSSITITLVTDYLQERLAPRAVRHGVLMDVYGLGVLIEGASGIGKSECALDLVARGHRLVSDDVVEVRRIGQERIIGNAPELLREHLEIRGLGIINIRDLFGVSAVSTTKNIDLSIKLERWDEAGASVDRLGIDVQAVEILGVQIPQVLIPVSPGRNLSTLVETAVRVQMLRARGYDAARNFVARHTEILSQETKDENQERNSGAIKQNSGAGIRNSE